VDGITIVTCRAALPGVDPRVDSLQALLQFDELGKLTDVEEIPAQGANEEKPPAP